MNDMMLDENDDMDGWGRREPVEPEEEDVDRMEAEACEPYQDVLPTDHVLPGQDGVPIAELNQTYCGTNHNMIDYYTVFDNGKENQHRLFTAIFTCPEEGEHFSSGDWGEKEVSIVDGVYWFTNRKQARNAAAARVLDVRSLRRCHGVNRKPFQRCRDKPYLLSEEAPALPDLPSGVVLPTIKTNVNDLKAMPKASLHEWYHHFQSKVRKKGGTLSINDLELSTYSTWNNLSVDQNDRRFTSVYTCPLTGERFASGTISGQHTKDYMYYFSDLQELKFKHAIDEDAENGVKRHKIDFIWYKTKKEAEDAAAARAIDCYRFRYLNTNDDGNHNYYCTEAPYTKEHAPELWKDVARTVDHIFQFEFSGSGDVVALPEAWPKLRGRPLSEEEIRLVFDDNDEGDELIRIYRQNREMRIDNEID